MKSSIYLNILNKHNNVSYPGVLFYFTVYDILITPNLLQPTKF